MMPFAWRWAKAGDRVHVHHSEPPYPLSSGVVVRARRWPHSTDVQIRVDGDDSVRRIARQWVHSEPIDPDENCPLCDL